jgi:Amt family ammonium transporter
VHGYNGLWGLLAVGIFADGTYGGVSGLIVGDTGQMAAQLIDAATVAVWAFGTGYILFALLKHTVGLRVSKEEELTGLDMGEHGYSAYPEFVTQEQHGDVMMAEPDSHAPAISPDGVRT